MLPSVTILKNGACVSWASPLGGFGHIADEQPLPFVTYDGLELTPRFGGEDGEITTSVASLPLPWGKLVTPLPTCQKIFNLKKRKINIYWRNFYRSFANQNSYFYFLEQLNFQDTDSGFVGRSPLLDFRRDFICMDSEILITDSVRFKQKLEFESLYIGQYAEFETKKCFPRVKYSSSLSVNNIIDIDSSTGTALLKSHREENIIFCKNERLSWELKLEIQV